MVNDPFSNPFMKNNLISSKANWDSNTSVGKIINTIVANILPEKYHSFRNPRCFCFIAEGVALLYVMSKLA